MKKTQAQHIMVLNPLCKTQFTVDMSVLYKLCSIQCIVVPKMVYISGHGPGSPKWAKIDNVHFYYSQSSALKSLFRESGATNELYFE